MSHFSDILNGVVTLADEDKVIVEGLITKYPDLDNSVVAKPAFEAVDTKLKGWEDWAGKNYDYEAGTTKHDLRTRADLQAAQQRIQQMEANGGGMPFNVDDFAEISRMLDSSGYVKNTELAGFAKKTDVDATVGTHFGRQGLAYEMVFTNTMPLAMKYQQEFGEILEPAQMQSLMQSVAGGIGADGATINPTAVYDSFVAQKRLDKKSKEIDERSAALAAKEQELTDRAKAGPLPTDEGATGVGHFQKTLHDAAVAGKTDTSDNNMKLGQGIAALAAEELRTKGTLVN